MNKTFTPLILFFFIYTTTNAQKVDLDRYFIPYSLTVLPINPLPAEYNSYNVLINTSPVIRNIVSNIELLAKINLNGFKKVDYNSDLVIDFKFSDLIINNVTIKDRFEVKKNKEGIEVSRTYYYWVEARYSYLASGSLNNIPLKKQLVNYTYGTNQGLYNSNDFTTREQASTYYYSNLPEIKSFLILKEINDVTQKLSVSLTNKYGYRPITYNEQFWIQGSKKHPEFEENDKIVEKAKFLVSNIKADQPITTEIRDSFNPVIDYFNNLKNRFNKDDKNDKKMRYSAFYNLAKIYIILEDWDKALAEAEGLMKNDYDISDGKTLIKAVEEAKEQLLINNTSSMHFVNLRLN